ncbi:ribosomal protein L4 [Gloeophyllum trabeum ATCC 11539]|uniref:Large ribosomal subunit protein uL4m n=1 Tax=Gloeophyllum trabeum (strain ATCC 11539 / FP-39264 / Madison 617) TaxID=670483 RepID=S7S3Z8_GLOTA|nr:ribosomal protein L4 [Gloeophyllum trabeum ATCC 11539]EPQ60564.1 ribosomal protein L4 [Gloeophyllum trabeum ATCC 11539]
MLSIFGHALAQTCRLERRQLATAALSTVGQGSQILRPEVIPYDQLQGIPSNVPLQAVSVVDPVYLSLSSLLHPPEGAPSPEEQIVVLDPTVFRHPIRRDILHLCVVHYLDSLRQGSASTKTRAEVRGSGRKIRPQKGSGRARLGDGQSPMLRGGGIAFGPKPRDFSTKLPRKVIQMGMRVGLSAKVKERALGIVESLEWPGTKTSELAARIEELGWRKTLFVTGKEEVPVGLARSISNIAKLDATTADALKVYDVVRWPRLVLDTAAVDYFERTLSKRVPLSPTALS